MNFILILCKNMYVCIVFLQYIVWIEFFVCLSWFTYIAWGNFDCFSRGAAKNKAYLKKMGITHVLNTAQGSKFATVDTDAAYYRDVGIKYMGMKLLDFPSANITQYFDSGANFIEDALSGEGEWCRIKAIHSGNSHYIIYLSVIIVQWTFFHTLVREWFTLNLYYIYYYMNIKERSSNTTLPKIKGQKAVVYDAIRYRYHVPPEFKMEFK